jgi:mRNA-degrading endonuclease toxin of MazEF toxin-antitoxin module
MIRGIDVKYDFKKKLAGLDGVNPIHKIKTDVECVIEIRELIEKLYKCMLTYKIDYGIKWLSGLQRYVDDKEDILKSTKWFKDHLARGHVVEVDLFGHFNKELTFAHPCVVLFDGSYDNNNGGWMLVAPISTPRYNDNNDFTVNVGVIDGLKHDSGVCIDSIQVIDKRRVLFQHDLPDKTKSKIRPEKLTEIDLKILEYYLPETFKKYNENDNALSKEKADHDQTKKELDDIKKLNEELLEKLRRFETTEIERT